MQSTGRSGNGAALPQFMQKALKHGINTREEEGHLARLVHRRGNKGRDARDALVSSNLRFILHQALRHSRFNGVELDDAFQEAALGHLEAIGRYKVETGNRLSTYSSWWIRHAVMRYGQDHGRNIRVPVNTLEKARKLARAAQEFERKHGRLPDDAELSEITGVPRKRIDAVRIAVMDALSLDEVHQDGEGQGRTLQDLIADQAPAADEKVNRETENVALESAMASLTPFEAAVLRCRFYEDKTLVETAEALAGKTRHGRELSRERIRQVEAVALGKLRAVLAELGPS